MSRPVQPSPAPGQASHYKLLGRIASGGMGAVYLGLDTREPGDARLVAIKIIHSHLAENRVFVDMLLDEAQVASNLHHPNVVGIIDVGAFRGRHFVVMPYVEGGTLSELVRRQKKHLPLALVIRVLIEALHGLHAAHTLVDAQGQPLGLVHRDVSPGNIMVGIDGITRVIDFGVAKAASRITHTVPGTVKGKFAYMAPEQAMGELVDCRADVFSAGVVLWTVLTGKRLFHGANSAHTIRNLMSAEIVPPSRIRPKIPNVLDRVCMHALHRSREKRYQSAAAMAADLQRAALAAGLETSQEDVGRMVSEAFAERIDQRRSLVEESRRMSQAITVDKPGFELEVVDLDDRAPIDSLTPPTPSARGPRRSAVLEVSGSDLSSGASKQPVKPHSETFSAMSDLSPEIRYIHTGMTPAEAHSVSGLVSGSQVPLDRASVVNLTPRPRGHGKYFVIAVLLMIAGAAVVMRDRVLELYEQLTSPPAVATPVSPQPATTDPVRIPIGADPTPPAPEPPAPSEPAVAVPGLAPAAAPDTQPPGDADAPAQDADVAPGAGAPVEATDTASQTESGTASQTESGTASQTGSDTATQAGSDTASKTPGEPTDQPRRRPRRETRPRNGHKKPPLDIEKNPYIDE
jgi:serine/threonine protein kinase